MPRQELPPYWPLLVLLVSFGLLTALYAWATPPLEASDELWHAGMVQRLATTGQLPVQDPTVDTIWQQEGSQPPLYYALVATLWRLTGIPQDFPSAIQPNPHAQPGNPYLSGNKNLVLHPTPPETNRAVLVGRLFSVFLGMMTVAAVYAAARTFATPGVALLAAALTAFNPMFIFITASVNNDNLVILLNSIVIWLMLRMLQDGFSTRRSLVIALLIALATMSKLSGLVLVPVVALAGFLTARRRHDWRGLVLLGASMAAFWLLIAGWWCLRNIQLYGELFGTSTMAAVAGERSGAFTLSTLLSEFEGFRVAWWGWFGAVNLAAHPAVYVMLDLLTVGALLGFAVAVWRTRSARLPVSLLALMVVLASGSVIAWTAQTYASQGRLLFPYIAAVNGMLAFGLSVWPKRTGWIMPAVLGILAAVVPFAVIVPAYSAPRPLSSLPDTAVPIYARFGDVELVGVEIPQRRYLPGDSVPVTLYWNVLQASEQDLSLWIHALAAGDQIGQVDSYPGGGTLRTSTWTTGIYADRYSVPVSSDFQGRDRLTLQAGWWDLATRTLIPITDASGQTLTSVMLDAGAIGAVDQTTLPHDFTPVSDIQFGGLIALVGYRLNDGHLDLMWESLATPNTDYTVFVQALGAENAIVGQNDAPPSMPTRYWQPGDRFLTQHDLTDISDATRIILGWYSPEGLTRLATSAPDNVYVIPLESVTP